MKKLLLFILLVCCVGFCFAQFTMNDTTFLTREVFDSSTMAKKTGFGYNYYHAIYFERNKNAEEYKWIADFGFDKFYGKEEYQRDIKSLKKTLHTRRLKKVSLNEIPTKWCMLYLLKDTFYVYSPSEYCWNYQNEITDSVFIVKDCEKTFSIIDTIVKKNKNFFQLKMKSIRYNQKVEKFNRTINIYIIDKKEDIAVFEDDYSGKKEYRLMVNAANVNHFPLIVNYCKTDKQFKEFEFDKINYPALIKNLHTK